MTGFLVYDRQGASRNQWFIQECLSQAQKTGLRLELHYTDELVLGADANGAFARARSGETPDFAIVRAMRPDISAAMEAAGVRLFNSARVSRVANDKRESALFAASMGIPMMATCFVTEPGAPCPLPFPAVVKPARGHGGYQVTWVADERAYQAALMDICLKDAAVVQPVASRTGYDKRVYCLGGQMLCAMERHSAGGLRANFSLGGTAVRAPITPAEARIVTRVMDELRPNLMGIDLLENDGQPVLNELEDVVGTRMLYAYTTLNAAQLYMRHVAEVLR